MRILKQVLTVFAIVLAMAFAPPAHAQTYQTLEGVWQGAYWGAGNARTQFQATLRDPAGPAFSGSMAEQNNFGTPDAVFLVSTLQGQASGASVSFTKRYDGTGGQTHAVTYSGQLQPGGRRIIGTWTLRGASGQFEMAR